MRVWKAAVLLLLLLLLSSAGAEEIPLEDLSGDASLYASRIANINRMISPELVFSASRGEEKSFSAPDTLVLCRTDGRELPVEGVNAEILLIVKGRKGRYSVLTGSAADADALCEYLNTCEGVLYAEPDATVRAADTDTPDGVTYLSYAVRSMGIDRFRSYCENSATGSVTVAVIDSGVYPHSLIRNKMSRKGYDYVDADQDPSNDMTGHGTAVAGIVADCTRNIPVYIYPIRTLGASGSGKISNVCNAIMEAVSAGADIINLSMSTFVQSSALDDAVTTAVSSGVTVVIAAGNDSCSTQEVWPAHLMLEGAVVVGSAEQSGGVATRASYSNYGASVDVYCYGTGVTVCSRSGGTTTQSGTSFAAPHISALAAMMKLLHPGYSPASLEGWLREISGTSNVNVPAAASLVPISKGYSLGTLRLQIGEELPLPSVMLPSSCREKITWLSSDPAVLLIDNGSAVPVSAGTAVLTASSRAGNEDEISVTVREPSGDGILTFPDFLSVIEEEAFMGNTGITKLILPEGLVQIGERAFSGCSSLGTITVPLSLTQIEAEAFPVSDGAVLLFAAGSSPDTEADYQYIVLPR